MISFWKSIHTNKRTLLLIFKTTQIHKTNINFQKLNQHRSNLYNVTLDNENKNIVLFSENVKENYPYVWLRDNCQCEKCFHAFSNSRTIMWKDFKIDSKPKSVELKNDCISIQWDDNHNSDYNIEWMLKRSFSVENREKHLNEVYRISKKLWDKTDFAKILTKHDFQEVLTSDRHLYEWLHSLTTYGVSLVENAPLNENECRKLADRVAFARKTHYGEEFHVKAKEGTSNVAYLSTPLQLHTDLPYYEYKPGVNLLHCIVQTDGTGGENQLTDCFYIANLIKNYHNEIYDTLKNVLVDWVDIGEENGNKFYKIFRAPVFCENSEGHLYRVNYSTPQRDSHFSVDIDTAKKWYEALDLFVKLIHEHTVEFKTKPGDILTFDNHRLVHGRLGYNDSVTKSRLLIGNYLDWDEIYSKLRVLKISLAQKEL